MNENRADATPRCLVCRGHNAYPFFELDAMPVLIGVLFDDPEAARNTRIGDIRLAFCPDCGFIWNTRFDARRLAYDARYDNSLHFSRVFQDYSRAVVQRLTDHYGIRDKRVADIGCGKGDFLAMLCEAGDNHGFGFDPSYDGERTDTAAASRIEWYVEPYSEEHASVQADLIASRYVLEHIPDPLAFLRMIARSVQRPDRTIVYFEVPNVDLIVRQDSVWDIIYEHVAYFGVESLTHVFQNAGFEVLEVNEMYGKQFVSVDARVAEPRAAIKSDAAWGDRAALAADVERFARRIRTKTQSWRERLRQWKAGGTRVVAWGAGAKAVGFLNMMQISDEIREVVDINPYKQGRHLAGTGQTVVAPDALQTIRPDVVVLMNPMYREEIAVTCRQMDIAPEFVVA